MPEIILVAFGCLALALDTILPRDRRRWIAFTALGGVAMAAGSVASIHANHQGWLPRVGFSRMVSMDEFALAFKGIVLLALALSVFIAARQRDGAARGGDTLALLLFAGAGAMLSAGASDLIVFYISVEMAALALYVLVSHPGRRPEGVATTCYLFGAVSSAVLLYGYSLLFALTGSTNLRDIAEALPALLLRGESGAGDARPLLALAALLVVAGLTVKAGAAPFHAWVLPAIERTPAPAAAFLSLGMTAAAFAILARILLEGLAGFREGPGPVPGWWECLAVAAAFSLVRGGIAALRAKHLAQLLAASISVQAGFVSAGLLAGNATGYAGMVVASVVHVATVGMVFLALEAAGQREPSGELPAGGLRGLAHRSPGLTALVAVLLLNLGGFPLTAGFAGRFYLCYGLVETGDPRGLLLGAIAVLSAAAFAAGCLMCIRAMYTGERALGAALHATPRGVWACVAVIAVVSVAAGLRPDAVLGVAKVAVKRFKPALERQIQRQGLPWGEETSRVKWE